MGVFKKKNEKIETPVKETSEYSQELMYQTDYAEQSQTKIEKPKKKKKKKFRTIRKMLYYMNRKNLIGELEVYGYNYSWKKMALSYVIAIALIVCVGLMYQMSYVSIMAIVLYVIISLPSLMITNYKSLYQQRRFSDANKYIEKMLYFFKVKPNIAYCLKDAIKIYKPGPMKELLEEALRKIVDESESESAKEEALDLINKEYACERIRAVNSFMLSIEKNGGDYSRSLRLLLDDRKLWAERTLQIQQKKKFIRTNIIIAILLVTALCVLVVHFPDFIGESIQTTPVGSYTFVQVFNVIYLALQVTIFMKADKKMCIDWLDDNDGMTDEEAYRKFARIMNYDASKEAKKGVVMAISILIATGLIWLISPSRLILAIGIGIAVFSLQQHAIGYNLAKKSLRKEIQKVFPAWMMDVALLMQTENVRMSIRRSYNTAPNILKPAIYQLLNDFAEDPYTSLPYDRFLEDFNIPEVQEAMNTLYSAGAGMGGNVQEEFEGIIERVNELRDKAEKIKNEDKLAVFKIYMTMPGMVGSLDMLVVMMALIFSFFTMEIPS